MKRKLEALLSLSQCKMRTRRQRTYFFKFVFSNSAHDHVCPPEQQRAGGGLFLLVAWQVRAFCLNFLKSPPLVAAPLRCLKQIWIFQIGPQIFSYLQTLCSGWWPWGPLLSPWWVGRVPSIPRTLFNTSPCIFHPFYCWLWGRCSVGMCVCVGDEQCFGWVLYFFFALG